MDIYIYYIYDVLLLLYHITVEDACDRSGVSSLRYRSSLNNTIIIPTCTAKRPHVP